MGKSPAFQLYVDDLLGSGTVQAASTEEIGAYILLMCYDWQEVGFVYDEERLAHVCRLPVQRFRKAWSHLSPKFPERDGRRFNPRLEKERTKQATWALRASEKGRKGADARWHGQCPEDATGIEKPMPGDGFPVSRFPVTANSPLPAWLDEIPDASHRLGVVGVLRSARNPEAVASSLESLHAMDGYAWPLIGKALVELLAGDGRFNVSALRAFCRRLKAGDPPPRSGNGDRLTQREKNIAVLDRIISQEGAAHGQ